MFYMTAWRSGRTYGVKDSMTIANLDIPNFKRAAGNGLHRFGLQLVNPGWWHAWTIE
jgi:hypothetical protein